MVDSFIPSHTIPLPEYPVIQEHKKLPVVSEHSAKGSQACVDSMHSSISENTRFLNLAIFELQM